MLLYCSIEAYIVCDINNGKENDNQWDRLFSICCHPEEEKNENCIEGNDSYENCRITNGIDFYPNALSFRLFHRLESTGSCRSPLPHVEPPSDPGNLLIFVQRVLPATCFFVAVILSLSFFLLTDLAALPCSHSDNSSNASDEERASSSFYLCPDNKLAD